MILRMIKAEREQDALGYDGTSVVVGHNMLGAYHDIVPRFDCFAWRKSDRILLHDLFDDSLRDARASAHCGSETPRPRPATEMVQVHCCRQLESLNFVTGRSAERNHMTSYDRNCRNHLSHSLAPKQSVDGVAEKLGLFSPPSFPAKCVGRLEPWRAAPCYRRPLGRRREGPAGIGAGGLADVGAGW